MNCDKCNKEIKLNGEELVDAKFLIFKDEDETYKRIRCNECYEKDKSLTNYKPCEVFSRVCGYFRPVQNWNKGMQQAYKDRKEFVIDNEFDN